MAHVIPRDHNAESWGDASLEGIGFLSDDLEIFFALPWPDWIITKLRQQKKNSNYFHINEAEFVILLLQFAATIQFQRDNMSSTKHPCGLPDYSLLLLHSDNVSAKKWINKSSAYSDIAANLLEIHGVLLQHTTLHPTSQHVAGENNDRADFLSRPHCLVPNNTHLISFPTIQLFQKLPYLNTYRTYHPSPELVSLITSALSCNVRVRSPPAPKNLGHFNPGTSIVSNSSWTTASTTTSH